MARLDVNFDQEQMQRARYVAVPKMQGELEHTAQVGAFVYQESSRDHSRTLDLQDYM